MSDQFKWARLSQIVSSIDRHRAWQDARPPRELTSQVFQLPRVSFKSYKRRIPHVMDVTVHQNSFGPNLSQQAPLPSVLERMQDPG